MPIDVLKDSTIPAASDTIKLLQQGLRKGTMTVEDVKKLQSTLGKASVNAYNANVAGVLNDAGAALKQTKENLLDHIQGSLSPADMKDFSAARAYSAREFEMYRGAPQIQKAAESEINARKLIIGLIGEGEVTDKAKGLGILSEYAPNGRKAIGAAKVAKALEESDEAGKINLGTFLNKTAKYTQTSKILGNDSYKSLQGLNKYLSALNNAAPSGGKLGPASVLGAVGATAGAGALASGGIAAAIPLATYAAATFAAQHSPLKTLLHAATKNLPTATYDLVVKNIEKHLTRAGYIMTPNGVLKRADEDDE